MQGSLKYYEIGGSLFSYDTRPWKEANIDSDEELAAMCEKTKKSKRIVLSDTPHWLA